LIQTRKISINCGTEIIIINNKTNTCYNYTTSSDYSNGNKTYIFQTDPNPSSITGQLYFYDNSGYTSDINMKSPSDFYNDINRLIDSKWVDDYTMSLMLYVVFYDLNMNSYVISRIVYENLGLYYVSTTDFQFLPLNQKTDYYLYVSMFFSIVLLFNYIICLKSIKKIPGSKNQKILMKILCCCCNFGSYVYNHYKLPSILQSISKNILLFSYFKYFVYISMSF